MTSNQYWWPDQLNLKVLRQNSPLSDPMDKDFDYAEAVKTLDVDALKQDIEEVDDDLARLVASRPTATMGRSSSA